MKNNNDKDFYIYKVSKQKRQEYNKRYNDKTKIKRHNQYLVFRNLQIQYYKDFNNDISKIPYKFLTQKDKKLLNHNHLNNNIKSLFSIFKFKK